MKYNSKSVIETRKLSKKVRHDILHYSFTGHGAHISSSLSITDILVVLYAKILRFNPKNPRAKTRDRFILSKGHAAPALYATLTNIGCIGRDVLATYGHDGTKLAAHPEYGVPGIELATGSLGHGLSVGIGIALSGKLSKKNYRVFVLVSDAELNEGSVWEALQFGSHHQLDNIVMIVDANGMQALGKTSEILNLEPLAKKFTAFGWSTVTVNGHNHRALLTAFSHIPFHKGKPSAVIANTITGKGVSFMEGQLAWHYRNLDASLYRKAISEVDL